MDNQNRQPKKCNYSPKFKQVHMLFLLLELHTGVSSSVSHIIVTVEEYFGLKLLFSLNYRTFIIIVKNSKGLSHTGCKTSRRHSCQPLAGREKCVFANWLVSDCWRLLVVTGWNQWQRGCCTRNFIVMVSIVTSLLGIPIVYMEGGSETWKSVMQTASGTYKG